MKNSIIEPSHILHKSGLQDDPVQYLRKCLMKNELRDFYCYNIATFSDVYLDRLLLRTKPLMQQLSLADWLSILEAVAVHKYQFRYLLAFFYKFVCIDLQKTWEQVNPKVAHQYSEIFQWTLEFETLLRFSKYDLRQLKDNGLDAHSFEDYAEQLVAQGGIPCVRIPIEFRQVDEFQNENED
jgi:hypothetical protein